MKTEGKFGEWTIFDGTNPPATYGEYIIAYVNTICRDKPPFIKTVYYGYGFFNDDTIDEAFYDEDPDWGDEPYDPYQVLAWMPLPKPDFDYKPLVNDYWERIDRCYEQKNI